MLHRAVSELLYLDDVLLTRSLLYSPRLRFDGCYISVVTYLRRGEGATWYAPSHLITFYRYFRFYASVSVASSHHSAPD